MLWAFFLSLRYWKQILPLASKFVRIYAEGVFAPNKDAHPKIFKMAR